MSEPPLDNETRRRIVEEAKRAVAAREEQGQKGTVQPPRKSGLNMPSGGIVGGLIALGVFLSKAKFLLTIGTMALSILLQASAYGFPMAIGITSMIFVHEMGHVFAGWRLKLPFQAMVFIPFFGAFVSHKGVRNAVDGAFLALLGPVFGGAFGVASLALYFTFRQHFWLSLAQFSFLINLVNLLPFPPLDGSYIAALFVRKSLTGGPAAYDQVRQKDRINYGFATGLLVLALLAGMVVVRVLEGRFLS